MLPRLLAVALQRGRDEFHNYERLSEGLAGLHVVAFAMLTVHRFVTFIVR